MATSGVHTFTMDVSDICEEAYERCGIEMRSGYDARGARRSLNLLLLEMGNHQVNLWKSLPFTLPLVAGQASYELETKVMDVNSLAFRKVGTTDISIARLNRDEYMDRPNKSTTSQRSTQYYFERTVPPRLYVWPVPDNNNCTIVGYAMEQIESVTEATETVDIPQRFVPAVIAGLAYYIALKRVPEKAQMLKTVYDEEITRAEFEDRERVSFRAIPSVPRI